MHHSPRLYLALVLASASTAVSQVVCVAGQSFPNAAIDREATIYNTAADLGLAVSESRIIATSNDKVQLRCRNTGLRLVNPAAATTIPLRGFALNTGAFVTKPDEPQQFRRMFDPRIIYDNYDHRFWFVASEGGAPDRFGGHAFDVGRIHINASNNAAPNSWTSADWKRCTWGGAKNPLDVQTDLGFTETFPDRCSTAVDATHLYLSYREGELVNPQDDTLVLVFDKTNITGPNALGRV